MEIRTKNNNLNEISFPSYRSRSVHLSKNLCQKIEFSQSPISRDLVNRQLISVQLIPYNKTEAHEKKKKERKASSEKKKKVKNPQTFTSTRNFSRSSISNKIAAVQLWNSSFVQFSMFVHSLTRFVKRVKEQLERERGGMNQERKAIFSYIVKYIIYEKIKYCSTIF